MPNKNLLKGFGAFWLIAGALAANAATPWSAETHQLAFGDFNGDGKTDLLYIANDPGLPSGIAVADAAGSPTVNHQSWASNYLGIPWHSKYYKPIVADYNGDGRADLLLQRQSTGDSYLLLANSLGQLTTIFQTIAYNMGGQIWSADGHRIVAGDFNGDGRRDLFLQAVKSSDLNAVFLASASGTFSSAQQTWGDSYMGFRWSLQKAMVHAGDFNADGKADLFVQARPDIAIIDYDISFPVPAYRPNSFGIVNGKTLSAGGEIFYGSALQIFSRNHLGLDWSAANFDVVIGNFDGVAGDDIFLQGKRSGLQNRLLLAQSGGQFTAGDALVDATLRNMTADQVKLHAANFDGTAPVGLYVQAQTSSGTNQIAATITGTVTFVTHDPNAMNVVVPGTAVGSISGEFSVDPSGAANYKIGVAVPSGVAGLAPDTALAYSSRAGNGLLGVGWQLGGLSAITRCPTTTAQDGVGNSDGVDFDGNDAFCLDGQRLMAVTGSNGSIGAEYRTELETHQKVTSSGTTAGDPDSFAVWDKSGLIREYGTQSPLSGTKIDANDSRFEARLANGNPGPGVIWAVKVIRDRFDNFIEYKYDQESTSNNFWPIEISYGSKINGPKTVVGRIVFTYTPREDTLSGYMTGGYVTSTTKRLQKISIYGRANPTVPGANDLVRQYYLDYEYSSTTKLSHLNGVTLCDGGAGAVQRCFKKTTFQWQYGYRGFSNSSVASDVDFGSTVDLKMLDADGDGRSDYVYRHSAGQNTGTWLVRYASLVHTKSPNGSYVNTNIDRKQSDRAFSMDWNNDGYADLVESTVTVSGNVGSAGTYRVLLGGPGGFNASNVYYSALPAEGLTYHGLGTAVGDFDGDGRQDIAYTPSLNSSFAGFGAALKLRLNNGIATSGLEGGTLVSTNVAGSLQPTQPSVGPPWETTPDSTTVNSLEYAASTDFKDEPTLYVVNFDGDGKDDILVRMRGCWVREYPGDTFQHTCLSEYQVYSLVNGSLQRVWATAGGPASAGGDGVIRHLKIGDFNGDGLSDVLMWGKGFDAAAGAAWHLDVGTGSKGLNGVTAFKNVMAANSISIAAVCSETDYTVFEYPGAPGYTGSSCTGGTSVSLTEQLLDSTIPLDYNRDGYTDLLAAKDGYWQVLPGGAAGYTSAFLNTGRQARQPKRAMLADDAGDGLPDILFPWGSDPENNWHVYYGRGPAVSGVIERFIDGLGAQTTVQYVPLTASTNTSTYAGTVYKGHTRFPEDANSGTEAGFRTETVLGWPNAHFAGPIPVVSQYTADNGLGAIGSSESGIRTTYEYWGLKINREGRGTLGFSQLRSWNDNSEIETRNRFAQQSFPLSGMMLTSEQRYRDLSVVNASLASGYDANALLLNYATACDDNAWCSQVNPVPAQYDENAAYKRVTFTTNTLSAALNTYGNGAKTYLPYVRKSTNDTHPVSGGIVGAQPQKRVVTEYLQNASSTAESELSSGTAAFDVYGNPGSIRITTTNGSSGGSALTRDEHVVLTTNTYVNDATNWCLARLSSSVVSYSKPGTNATANSHAINPVVRSASYAYQDGAQCTLSTETIEPSAQSGQLRLTKTYAYDTYGNRYKETAGGYGIPSSEERTTGAMLQDGTSSFVATQGQFPTQTRNARGHAETSVWDGRLGAATITTGPNGGVSEVQFDTFGRKIKETPSASLPGVYSSLSSFWCNGTGMCWDPRSVFAARSIATDGSQTWVEYDRLGREIETRRIGFDGNWINAEKYFDPLGREYLASKPYKPASQSTRCWSFKTFDVIGRATSEWQSYLSQECTASPPAFNSDPVTAIGAGKRSTIVYDIVPNPAVAGSAGSNGIAQKVVGNAGDTSVYATARASYKFVNVMGLTRFVQEELVTNGCPSAGSPLSENSGACLQSEYDYDAQGNITYTRQVGTVGTGTNATTKTLEIKTLVNIRGFKTSMSDPDMGTWSYEYNSLGELKKQTDARGHVTELWYDQLGRMISRVEKLNGSSVETTSAWGYDTAANGVGKIASATSSNGYAETYFYDAFGRLSQLKRQIDGNYYFIDQTYDALGRVDVMKYPGSVEGDSASGPEADANRLRVRNVYNGYGFLSAVQDLASGTVYWNADSMNEMGRITQETLGNGRITKRGFDRATGYLATIKTGSSSVDSETQNLEFGFDQAANVRIRKDMTSGVNAGNGIREEYEYDGLYRLKQMRQYKPASLASAAPSRIENYAYDGFGNLLAKGTSYTTYCYNTQAAGSDPCSGVTNSRPHAAARVRVEGTSRDFGFDANGNVVSASNALYDTVSWHVSNLAKRVSKGAKYSEFAYSPDRSRFKQYLYRSSSDTELTNYVGVAFEKLVKTSGATVTTQYTHYIRAGGEVVVIAKRDRVGAAPAGVLYSRYLHRDHIGSIVAITDASGALVERSAFDPWGKRTSYATWDPVAPGSISAGGTGALGLTNGIVSTKRGFTAHEHVDELGFVHMNGRIYDSELGRFFSPDPTVQFPESTQGFNRYSYAGNNPLTNFDPSGFSFAQVLSILGTILSFIPVTAWIGLILNAVVGFMQGGIAGGVLAIAGAFVPGGGNFWARLAINAAKSLVSNTILGAANGYQTSLGKSFRASLKGVVKEAFIATISQSVTRYIGDAIQDARAARTSAKTDGVVDEAASNTANTPKKGSCSNDISNHKAKTPIPEDGLEDPTVPRIEIQTGKHTVVLLGKARIMYSVMGDILPQVQAEMDQYSTFKEVILVMEKGSPDHNFATMTVKDKVVIFVSKGAYDVMNGTNTSWTKPDIASFLAHEFVHVVQRMSGAASTVQSVSATRRWRELEAYSAQLEWHNAGVLPLSPNSLAVVQANVNGLQWGMAACEPAESFDGSPQ